MRVVKVGEAERVLEEIPIRLGWLDTLKYFGIWPPHPIDLLSFRADGEQLEALISDLHSNPASKGNSSWPVTYSPRAQRWKVGAERRGSP